MGCLWVRIMTCDMSLLPCSKGSLSVGDGGWSSQWSPPQYLHHIWGWPGGWLLQKEKEIRFVSFCKLVILLGFLLTVVLSGYKQGLLVRQCLLPCCVKIKIQMTRTSLGSKLGVNEKVIINANSGEFYLYVWYFVATKVWVYLISRFTSHTWVAMYASRERSLWFVLMLLVFIPDF